MSCIVRDTAPQIRPHSNNGTAKSGRLPSADHRLPAQTPINLTSSFVALEKACHRTRLFLLDFFLACCPNALVVLPDRLLQVTETGSWRRRSKSIRQRLRIVGDGNNYLDLIGILDASAHCTTTFNASMSVTILLLLRWGRCYLLLEYSMHFRVGMKVATGIVVLPAGLGAPETTCFSFLSIPGITTTSHSLTSWWWWLWLSDKIPVRLWM